MNILIADDDSTSRIVLSTTLKKLGHQVTVTKSGSEALAVLKVEDVPLLISDVVMPDVDGLELCRRIRAANHTQYTYIILLTSVGGKWGYLVGMKAGADDFINKPIDEEQLSARLAVAERLLNLQSQVKELSKLLPICFGCKKVRDDQNYRQQVDSYIAKHTDANLPHGYCPECSKEGVGEKRLVPVAEVVCR